MIYQGISTRGKQEIGLKPFCLASVQHKTRRRALCARQHGKSRRTHKERHGKQKVRQIERKGVRACCKKVRPEWGCV